MGMMTTPTPPPAPLPTAPPRSSVPEHTSHGPVEGLPVYLLLALRGLEFLVVEEIRAKLQVEYLHVCSVDADPRSPHINVFQGEAAVGRILLQTRSPPAQVQGLQSVQAVLAFLVQSDAIVTDRAEGTTQIAELVMAADWESAMGLWRAHMQLHRPARMATLTEPTFRGSCVRDGRHAYKSTDIAGDVGAGVIERFGWTVDLTHCDLEVVCVLFRHHLIAGISLANPERSQFRNRVANEDRSLLLADAQYVSTLRPSTTTLLLRLAEIQDGDVVLDSMCGVGTIPICAADEGASARVFALGGELDALPVAKAQQNAQHGRRRGRHVDIAQWDSTRLPLRDATIDRVVIDLPFGIRCGNPRQHSKIYPKVLKELHRVLRPGGRAVLLTSLKKTFLHSLGLVPLRLHAAHDVNIGGLLGAIYVVDKIHEMATCAQ